MRRTWPRPSISGLRAGFPGRADSTQALQRGCRLEPVRPGSERDLYLFERCLRHAHDQQANRRRAAWNADPLNRRKPRNAPILLKCTDDRSVAVHHLLTRIGPDWGWASGGLPGDPTSAGRRAHRQCGSSRTGLWAASRTRRYAARFERYHDLFRCRSKWPADRASSLVPERPAGRQGTFLSSSLPHAVQLAAGASLARQPRV